MSRLPINNTNSQQQQQHPFTLINPDSRRLILQNYHIFHILLIPQQTSTSSKAKKRQKKAQNGPSNKVGASPLSPPPSSSTWRNSFTTSTYLLQIENSTKYWYFISQYLTSWKLHLSKTLKGKIKGNGRDLSTANGIMLRLLKIRQRYCDTLQQQQHQLNPLFYLDISKLPGLTHEAFRYFAGVRHLNISDTTPSEVMRKKKEKRGSKRDTCHYDVDSFELLSSLDSTRAYSTLISLDISSCGHLSANGEELFRAINPSGTLKHLNISYLTSDGITDASFQYLKGLRKLEMVACGHMALSNEAFGHLKGSIEHLNMGWCDQREITDESLLQIGHTLKSLDISYCTQFSNRALQNLSQLESIKMFYGLFTPAITTEGFHSLKGVKHVAISAGHDAPPLPPVRNNHQDATVQQEEPSLSERSLQLDAGQIFEILNGNTQELSFYVADQPIQDEHLKHLTNIQRLSLRYCSDITDEGLKYLSGTIKSLELLGPLPHVTQDGIANLRSISELTIMDGPYLTEKALGFLKGSIRKLNILPLHVTPAVQLAPWTDEAFENLAGIETLILKNSQRCSQLSNDAFRHLQGIKELDIQGWEATHLTQDLLFHLKGIHKLNICHSGIRLDALPLEQLHDIFSDIQEVYYSRWECESSEVRKSLNEMLG